MCTQWFLTKNRFCARCRIGQITGWNDFQNEQHFVNDLNWKMEIELKLKFGRDIESRWTQTLPGMKQHRFTSMYLVYVIDSIDIRVSMHVNMSECFDNGWFLKWISKFRVFISLNVSTRKKYWNLPSFRFSSWQLGFDRFEQVRVTTHHFVEAHIKQTLTDYIEFTANLHEISKIRK